MTQPIKNGITTQSVLISEVQKCLADAVEYSWDITKEDGHWNGELQANPTMTAEHIFFYQTLGLPVPDPEGYRKYLLSEQQDDGSWSIAPHYPGDVSTSSEVYLALRLLGMSVDTPELRRARMFIRKSGGVAKVRIFTRIYFAQFGLLPWDAVPQLPAEFILLPSALPINIYRLASWARALVIPWFIIRHHEPIYALPNGKLSCNGFLDELWLDPRHKVMPYGKQFLTSSSGNLFSMLFGMADGALYWLGGLKRQPLRSYALRKCVDWILKHQDVDGGWGGLLPHGHAGIQALLLQRYTLKDKPIQRALESIEALTWKDESGTRMQAAASDMWDTLFMLRGLCDVGVNKADSRIQRAVAWIESRQNVGPEGDWRVYNRNKSPGGFSFGLCNAWFPDLDDTAAAILALLHQNPKAVNSLVVSRAADWICGMQNADGGWGAFDHQNDRFWMNEMPFADMEAMCDPSSADITGRVLEAFGFILQILTKVQSDAEIRNRMTLACEQAIYYLAVTQEPTGSWFGQWGTNYIYGTANALSGLQFFRDNNEHVQDMMSSAADWLKLVQNTDGGWGEDIESYNDASLAGIGESTPSQTAWGLIGLLTMLGPDDPSVLAAVAHLTGRRISVKGSVGCTWNETKYTGVGFPRFWYFGYTLYRHYFPMMALGRYLKKVNQTGASKGSTTQINGEDESHVSKW